MESVVWIVVIVIGLLMFGKYIKSMLDGSAEMAHAEFNEFRADQVVRHMHNGKSRAKKFQELKDEDIMTANDIIAFSKGVK